MWRKIFFVLGCCLLVSACSNYFYVQEPFKVALAEQVFTTEFELKKEYDYRIAVIFDWDKVNDRKLREKQGQLVGWSGKGISFPLDVTIVKDGDIFLDTIVYTDRANYLEGFCLNTATQQGERPPSLWNDFFYGEIACVPRLNRRRIWGPARTVEIRTLPPGEYRVKVRTIIPIKEFAEMDTFIEIFPYSPKI